MKEISVIHAPHTDTVFISRYEKTAERVAVRIASLLCAIAMINLLIDRNSSPHRLILKSFRNNRQFPLVVIPHAGRVTQISCVWQSFRTLTNENAPFVFLSLQTDRFLCSLDDLGVGVSVCWQKNYCVAGKVDRIGWRNLVLCNFHRVVCIVFISTVYYLKIFYYLNHHVR